ncbi:hypothetical protein Rs2_14605 [Raphanus sativus]|nr:hypothetical protein Rs2_14605 [Raphanus sativus]
MVMKREEMEAAKRRSRFDRGIYKVNYDFQKHIRFSSEHGCMVLDIGASSSSTSTVRRDNAQIYTRDLISTFGSRDTRDVNPNLGENSSITNDYKDWGLICL